MGEAVSQLSFEEHVKSLTTTLQIRHNLTVDGSVLGNRLVRLSFGRGDPREPYVSASISYSDDSLFRAHSKAKSFHLHHYITYLGIPLDEVYPYARSDQSREYSNTAYAVLAQTIFLTMHGKLILDGDPKELEKFGKALKEKNRKYTEQFLPKKHDTE